MFGLFSTRHNHFNIMTQRNSEGLDLCMCDRWAGGGGYCINHSFKNILIDIECKNLRETRINDCLFVIMSANTSRYKVNKCAPSVVSTGYNNTYICIYIE